MQKKIVDYREVSSFCYKSVVFEFKFHEYLKFQMMCFPNMLCQTGLPCQGEGK